VAMATVDPGRDTAAKLTDYVTTFVPDGIALRTEDQTQLRAATNAFGADYMVTTGADGKVEVSHTGELYVVDDHGSVILAWPFGTSMKAIRSDLAQLLAGERPPTDR
ncbi:MAG: SCO family protein, partial [Actinobacteria bacterium]|nr:SCO family protein [Actinomycetota bacterium]